MVLKKGMFYSMKAIIHSKYGPPETLELKEVEKPKVGDDAVLVKVHATAVNAYDWHILRADPFLARLEVGLFKPKKTRLGVDVAGVVEATGRNVQKFHAGDAVFADISASGGGGFAEYVSVPGKYVACKPVNLSFEAAAAVPMAAVTALQGLRDLGQVQPGMKVLINGASGGVGTFAVQIAKALGAEVTAVCSTSKIDLVYSLGADHVIDYTREDFLQSGERYPLILGISGFRPLVDYQRALTPQGKYIMVGGTNAQIFQAAFLGPSKSRKGGQTMRPLNAVPSQKDLDLVRDWLEVEKIVPVVDRTFRLDEVPAAIRYLEERNAKGKIVIKVI